jgi:acetolactate synthase-1/2/3 large subunit
VDVLKSLPLDYIATMPGSTFRGLHESIINYGNNKAPELLTCLHEEIAVGMGHGYAKVANKPMGALLHGVVGLQHGSMAIYNAWADRVPIYVMVGNTLALEERRPGVEWTHSAQDNAAMVRDYTKWDDMPVSLPHFAESGVRAWRISMTPPFAPTVITVDGELAERAISEEAVAIPRLTRLTAPVGDPNAVMQAAKMLVGASNPVILVDRLVRTDEGMQSLVALAEALQAPVIDKGGRMNFPSRHPLNHTGSASALLHNADVVLGLEVNDLWGAVNNYRDRIVRESAPVMKSTAKLITISAADLLMHPNIQDFQRYQPADLAISGDGEATLPILVEAVKRSLPKPDAFADRGAKLKEAFNASLQRYRQAATYAWDASPISVARLCAEIYGQIEHENWALVSASQFQSDWPTKLWDFKHSWQHIGGAGGSGVGYTGPSSIGAALAHRDAGGGRLPVSIMGDGEIMCCPGTFWTAAHHRIPLLMVMHNNRAYHQEVMHVQRMADRHGRGIDRAGIGTVIQDPNIDFAKMADSMGVWSTGPIEDPAKLGPALQQAIAVVKQGLPALVDVVCQPR